MRKGQKMSEESKEKLRQKCIGRKLSEETKKKISEMQKGKIVSDETKHKMSEAQKNRPTMSKETKEKKKDRKYGVRP